MSYFSQNTTNYTPFFLPENLAINYISLERDTHSTCIYVYLNHFVHKKQKKQI